MVVCVRRKAKSLPLLAHLPQVGVHTVHRLPHLSLHTDIEGARGVKSLLPPAHLPQVRVHTLHAHLQARVHIHRRLPPMRLHTDAKRARSSLKSIGQDCHVRLILMKLKSLKIFQP